MTNTAVKTGEGGRKSTAPRWPFILAIVAVVVVAAGIGAVVRWYDVFFKGEPKTPAPEALPAVVEEVQNLQLDGETEKSDQKITELLANSSTSQSDKYALYIMQGDSAGSKQEFQAAADAYAKAAAIRETYEVTSKLGAAWDGIGDKQKAISYYRRAIQLMPQDSPTRDADKRRLEMSIEYLESGQ